MTTITNKQRSADEVAAFMNDTPGPYFAYHNAKSSGLDPVRRLHHGDDITTWTGDRLARVIETNQPWRDNFDGIRQNFRARGINGVTYSGTAYLTAGDYVRMRPVKS